MGIALTLTSVASQGEGRKVKGGAMAHVPGDDAQLLQRVLEDALQKLDLLENMQSLQDNSSTDELSQRIGDEISAVIQEQKDLQRQYGELVDKRSTLTGYANAKKLAATEAQIAEVGEQLNVASKTLSRTLISNPNIAENLNKIQKERRQVHTIFTITIAELRSGKFETLDHTVEQDKKDREEFAQLKADEKESREQLAQYKAELEDERKLHQKDVNSRNEEIMKLKVELHDLKNRSTMEKTYLTKEATAHINSTERRFQQIEHKYCEQTDLMEKKVAREKAAYEANQLFLIKRAKELHDMGDDWQDHYETVREKKENEFEKLTKDEEQTRTQLEDTCGRYNTENAIKKALIAEDERKEENRIRMEKERELKEAAALKVQRAWAWHKKYGPPPKKKGKKKKK